jgi:hypothetical protein
MGSSSGYDRSFANLLKGIPKGVRFIALVEQNELDPFPLTQDAEVVAVEFLTVQGGIRLRKLLVDSGFTGKSSVILGADTFELVRAAMPAAQATGAL